MTDLERMRIQLWCEVWSKTASANDCKTPETATTFADAAIRAFDKRFLQANDRMHDRIGFRAD